MSLFRRPKKPIQRRVFSAAYDEDNTENEDNGADNRSQDDENEKMDLDRVETPPPPSISTHKLKEQLNDKKLKDSEKKGSKQKSSLLSFGDEGMCIILNKRFFFF